jgi:hypothetical protein
MEHNCLTCKYAKWDTDKGGKRHRSGDGRCQWQMPDLKLPVAFYFIGYPMHSFPKPSGGFIARKRLEHCDTWAQ